MRHPMLALAIPALLAVPSLTAAQPTWQTRLADAKAEAKQRQLPLMVLFTGSDWCPYCIHLEAEVFKSKEFEAFASKAVLVKLDYPRKQDRSPEKLAANKGLADLMTLKDQHQITGFPTVLWLSPDGKELNRVVSYKKGTGAAAYLAQFQWPTK